MADALAKYRAALKRYRKDNPKVPYATAQKRVSAEMKSGKVSGAKKKRRVGSPAASRKTAIGSPSRKTAIGSKKRTVSKKKTAIRSKGTQTRMQKATKLVRDIEKLEIRRKAEKARQMKDVIQIEINRLHDQLDSLNRSSKRKSA